MARSQRDDHADVCLIFEGSYPYTQGGVSIWAHDLIGNLPHLKFHLWCLVAKREELVPRYELPENVVDVTNVVLFEENLGTGRARIPDAFFEAVRRLHDRREIPRRVEILWNEIGKLLPKTQSLPVLQYLLDPRSYELLVEMYLARDEPLSFLDYFYTYLFAHLPLMNLMGQDVPRARLYHAVSTGYAGFLGCKAKRITGSPLLLTEHGIYTNERQVEIILADWIYSRRDRKIQIGKSTTSLKQIWMKVFQFLGKLTYDQSNRITTLFRGNKDMEVRFGADPEKIDIIPNGVDLDRYSAIERRPDAQRPLVALVGRVVPIKDIRTFIKACRVVADAMPHVRFKVLGTIEQSPAYYAKCLEYRHLMRLDVELEFTGNVDVAEYYGEMDVSVLTSVSEALPLTVLESMACGIPVVSTRVGSCEELLMGKDDTDRELGACGIIAQVGNHREVGEAIVRILTNEHLYERMSRVGKERVRNCYDIEIVRRQYADLYEEWLAHGPVDIEDPAAEGVTN